MLVADSRLGGISSSISAYESLLLRGYDVHSVLLFRDDYYQNHEYLRHYFQDKSIPLVPLPAPPVRPQTQDVDTAARDEEAMTTYYQRVAQSTDVGGLLDQLAAKNTERIDRLEAMASRAQQTIWYPFTQHHGMQPKDITAIDSAYDDYFQTLVPTDDAHAPKLQATFDGSASWWTQGLGHGNPALALSAAYAAGRYGHVMFPGNIHEPALSLAEKLLQGIGNARLQKIFYTDNGSTGMEVAVKMGLRAACHRYGWDASTEQISILGLKGSYHGDTIGVMDCSEPSTYNKKVEWYRGRGYWFDFPQVRMSQGVWRVDVPECLRPHLGADLEFPSLGAVFDVEQRVRSDEGKRYRDYIRTTIAGLVQQGMKFGSLIMEPIILGAGGMLFWCVSTFLRDKKRKTKKKKEDTNSDYSDPLFQRSLVDVVRHHLELFAPSAPRPTEGNAWSGLPVILDEVFTGLYRLGRRSSASFIGVDADIAVNAKLLTGGLVPLCTTAASQEIFRAFDSPDKSDALLHGHSYTAHAVGCQVAVDSLNTMMKLERNGSWDDYRRDWASASTPEVWSVWSHDLVRDLSCAESVNGVFAIGTVLVVSLQDLHGSGGKLKILSDANRSGLLTCDFLHHLAGYTSTAARGLQQKLSAGGPNFAVHSRVLGNVLYLMSSVTSRPTALREIEGLLRAALL